MKELSDILYVEDDVKNWGNPFLEFAEDRNMKAKVYSTLGEFTYALTDGNRARLYVVDGNFPNTKGERPERLAEKAIGWIRAMDDSEPKILIFSADDYMENLAKKLEVDYLPKSQGVMPMINYAKNILGTQ